MKNKYATKLRNKKFLTVEMFIIMYQCCWYLEVQVMK